MAQGSIELRHVSADTSNHDDQELDVLGASSDPQAPGTEFSLPPVDTGAAAWLFLAACWGVEALTFGEILHREKMYFQDLLKRKQALASPLVCSRTTTVLIVRSLAPVVSPLLELLQRCEKPYYYYYCMV
jgi:hypothetical protein